MASALSRVAVSEIVDSLRERGLHHTNKQVSRCIYLIEHIDEDKTAVEHIVDMIDDLANTAETLQGLFEENYSST